MKNLGGKISKHKHIYGAVFASIIGLSLVGLVGSSVSSCSAEVGAVSNSWLYERSNDFIEAGKNYNSLIYDGQSGTPESRLSFLDLEGLAYLYSVDDFIDPEISGVVYTLSMPADFGSLGSVLLASDGVLYTGLEVYDGLRYNVLGLASRFSLYFGDSFTLMADNNPISLNGYFSLHDYSVIRDTAYNSGSSVGYGEGYGAGYGDGYSDGYDVGYIDGKNAGAGESINTLGLMSFLFGSIANVPIVILNGLTGFTVFDTTIIAIVLAFMILTIGLWIVRKFI